MRGKKVVRLTMAFDIAMSDIAEATAMAENVERAGIAIFQRERCILIGFGIVDEDAPFVGALRMIDPHDLKFGIIVTMPRAGKVDAYLLGGENLGSRCWTPWRDRYPCGARTGRFTWRRNAPSGCLRHYRPPPGISTLFGA